MRMTADPGLYLSPGARVVGSLCATLLVDLMLQAGPVYWMHI